MTINLKPILASDSDNIKLDKVNYNFDQLVANGGGPQGFDGAPGAIGFQGVKGDRGFQGVQGAQGTQGPNGEAFTDLWKTNEGDPSTSTIDTLVPIHDLEGHDLETFNPPSVVIGYHSTDPQYGEVEEDSQFVINRHPNFNSNLELGVASSLNSYRFKLDHNITTSTTTLTKFFTANPGSNTVVEEIADQFIWATTTDDLVTLDSSLLDVLVDSEFENVEVSDSLKITSGNPGVDKIAVSKNASGEIEFKSVEELGGFIPIGTIISMNPDTFDSNINFIKLQTTLSDSSSRVQIKVGSGVGEYTGWYLCNGQTWTDGESIWPVPNLNSYSYIIDEDTNSTNSGKQLNATGTNNQRHLIGGSDSSLDAIFNSGTNMYTIEGLVETENLGITSGGGVLYTVKRLPQIIYLGAYNLYWIAPIGDIVDPNPIPGNPSNNSFQPFIQLSANNRTESGHINGVAATINGTIEVISNIPWTATSNQSWLVIMSGASGIAGNSIIAYDHTGDSDPCVEQTAIITVTSLDLSRVVTFTLTQTNTGFMAAPLGQNFNIPATGGTRTLQIKSNLAWTIQLPLFLQSPGVWPSGQLSGTSNATIEFTTGDNTSIPQSPTTSQSGNIVVTFTIPSCVGGGTRTVSIPYSQGNGADEPYSGA